MNKFIISCDTTCDIPQEVKDRVSVESMIYSVDKEEFGGNTGNDMDIEMFYNKMREGKPTYTSQISQLDAEEYFDKLVSKGFDVLHIPLAAALSATSDNHIKAAEAINKKYGRKCVYSVDSLSQAGGLGLLATLALEKADSGATIEETYNYVNEIKGHICHYFVVDDLIYLHRGGRVSKASAVIGTWIRIKPVLHTNEIGQLIPLQKVLSRKKSLQRLVEKMKERYNGESKHIYISHGDCIEDANYVAHLVKEGFGLDCKIMQLCRVVGCHSGPGTVALFFTADSRKEN
ncbi:MAG: DegV family protein [Clostridia bacterium]